MQIRRAESRDGEAIASIILPVIREGTTYALDRGLSREAALAYWLAPDKTVFVAEDASGDGDGAVLGTYYLRANQPGGGAHVANCGYMTAAAARGRGVARRLCEHSLAEARARGYRAMQFNFVVSTNAAAVGLWQKLGFAVVGRLPGAFAHPAEGFVDALVMYRSLVENGAC